MPDYDEIRKEIKLALQECGRKLGTYLRRRLRMKRESERRGIFERYIGEIARGCEELTGADAKKTYAALLERAESKTAEADQVLDDEGRVIDDVGKLAKDSEVVIRTTPESGARSEDLFGETPKKKKVARKASARTTKKKRTRGK